MATPVIGVLALQGDFREHASIVQQLGCPVIEVRTIADFKKTAGLIIPGGESTVIGRLLHSTGLWTALRQAGLRGYPMYGTCAGCILLAKRVDSPYSLKLIDITVKRNAYGRQLDSFEGVINVEKRYIASLRTKTIEASFIRAPQIMGAGKNIDIIASYQHEIVLARQNNILAGTFHPEINGELAVHHYFIQLVKASV